MKNKQIIKRVAQLFFLTVFLLTVNADEISGINFEKFRVILPPSVASGTAVYGVIKNTGLVADTLTNITSNAGSAMLHKTEIQSGIATMNHILEFKIEPNSQLELKPMSYHIMLMNINHSLIKEGSKIFISFEFKKAGIIKIEIPVLR